MLSIELSINIFLLASVVVGAALIGFALRAGQIAKCRNKIEQLEREILNNYAEILNLEKENTSMESKLQDIQSPVIAMKGIKEESVEGEKFPDMATRKKLLSRENLLKQQSVASK